MKKTIRFFIVLLLFCSFCISFAQKSTAFSKTISVEEFKKMRDAIFNTETSNVDSIMIAVENMMQIAYTFKNDEILAKALNTKSLVESKYTNQDRALLTLQKAIKINKKIGNKEILAANYTNAGLFNFRKSNYVEATSNYLKSISLDKSKKYNSTSKAYSGLSDINTAQKKYPESLKYALLAKENLIIIDDESIAHSELVIGICYSNLKDFNKAEINFTNAENKFEKLNNKFRLAYTYNEHSDMYLENNPLKAIEIKLKAKAIFDEIAPDRLTTAYCLAYLGELYITVATNDSLLKKITNPKVPKDKISLFNDAELFYNKALIIAEKNNTIHGILDTKEHLSKLQALKGDYKNAFLNLSDSKKLNDSLFSQENKNVIAKLESEKEVLELKSKNEKKANLNKILTITSIAFILIGFLVYRNFRNRQKLQNLKISKLEKDKQLLVIDAMLKGQEEERGRIAKDLHDGLGGLLSGTKLSFTNMKENLILTTENAEQFDKSLSMLDTTIADLRKVAHNLMPEALVKFGLNDALRDFCNSIQSSTNLIVDFQKLGVERQINSTANTFIYRIIQELVNNAVKHADASEILVQLVYAEKKIELTVEDNGKGYDVNQIKKGDGLDNIMYRVNYFNGKMDTNTSGNNGTSINIELNV